MARYENDWDRDRHDQDWERERWSAEDRERERGERRPQRQAYTGWAGRGFNQGSFGRFGGQGSNLYSQYGGQGYGAQHGYTRREVGGGMSTYTGRDYERDYEEPRQERWTGRRGEGWSERDRYETRDREEWGRDWGGQGFSGREGGWGGYGSYDRERPAEDRGRDWDRNWNRDRERSSWAGSYPYRSGGQSEFPAAQPDWSRRGQFAGRGPKNWQRSDDRIREDINERLTDHPDIDASEIEVTVSGGEVTLIGEVGDRETKRLAEDIAERVSGVRDVHNQIRVNRGFWGAIKDAFTGENRDDETVQRDASGQPETTTAERVSTARLITPQPETTAPSTKEPAGHRK